MAKLAAQPGMEAEGTPLLEYEILDQAETRRRLPLVGETVAGAIFSRSTVTQTRCGCSPPFTRRCSSVAFIIRRIGRRLRYAIAPA
ncbi:hypothetical protein QDX27_08215 [Rhizobium sp. BR 318]|uniref:hypothetical protein n=1 Tax=Rhizobium sp. BR 318 TaxID=3040669 RepID=UPI002F3E2CF4